MAITAEQKFLLNRYMGPVAAKVQLGTLIQNAESVVSSEVALANGKVLIGNVSGVAAEQTVSGDITISNAGVAAIAAGVVALADLSSGIAPSHVVKFAGTATLTNNATQSISIPGVLATDVVFVQLKTASAETISYVAANTDAIDLVLSGAPGTPDVYYQVLRAAA